MGEQYYDSVFLDEVRARISTDDVCTLIYTSGTTGNPKGVMLTHRNFIDQILHLKHIIDPVRDRRALSFLPLCHVYERMLVYLYLYMNITTYYAQSLGTIVDDIKIANPQIMSCVPRVLERIYIRLRDKGNPSLVSPRHSIIGPSELPMPMTSNIAPFGTASSTV